MVDRTRWQELLGRVRRDVPRMLDEFLAELAEHDGYADAQFPRDDLERTAVQAFELLLTRLENDDGNEAALAFATQLGQRRARQGLRIDQFTDAVRINFRLLWRALHRAAQPDLVEELMANGEQVLTVVERYATDVQKAFSDETQRMADLHRTAQERSLARLFSGPAADADARQIAETLSLTVNDTYEMFALPSESWRAEQATQLGEGRMLAYDDGEVTFLIRARGPVDWRVSVPHIDGAYLARIPGIGHLHAASVLAKRLVGVYPSSGTGAFTLKDGFHLLAGETVRSQVAGFEHELIGRFHESDSDERARFQATLREFVRTGSVQETADRLFVHRNTVFKRIRAFESITDLDLMVPRDAAIALFLVQGAGSGVEINTDGTNPATSRH
ncbi:hypothetical protein GCM10011490_20740 [Pseudoclavibacter endophyticus]|uniref:PucR family transcriptional regulator n=1 Tax=Pseudoclavibacter endophyticus TaxID=1778590 RepID=A0A6H9WMZ0_9MICO|nr:helix-turn-helix domain-containing protein [Pseudoclavibacter endophyticus]KAB1648128.1 PucR family transcriptional regulator [Pseudoclavibacter endophyticus]GGA69960.1 hypothetical protein GCM10011490_20740 [Pseudoclavibacter endophyticus]